MKTLKQSFASAKAAEQFLRKIRPMVAWTDSAANHPCSIVARSDYPLEVPSIEHCRFRGIESIESKFKPKLLPQLEKAISGSFRKWLARSGSAHFIFRANDTKDKRRAMQFSLSVIGNELLIRFVPATRTSDINGITLEYTRFFAAVGIDAAVAKTASGFRFKAGKGIRIDTPQMDGKDLPSLVDCYLPDSDRAEWLTKIVREWANCGLVLENPEFVVSFPYASNTTEAAARKAVSDLNAAGLPIKSAQLELYYTIDSALGLQGLIALKKVDRDDSTIEVTVAECVLPSKLKGYIAVTARKSDLLVELHAQEAPDEDDFVKETRELLNEHPE